jgi:hypothetical protein
MMVQSETKSNRNTIGISAKVNLSQQLSNSISLGQIMPSTEVTFD